MCRFEYFSYGGCGHSVIDCLEVCAVSLWRAGLSGDLVLCVPAIFGRSTQWTGRKNEEPPQRTTFIGLSGLCNACGELDNSMSHYDQKDNRFDYTTDYNNHHPHDPAPYFHVKQLLTTFPHLLAIDRQLTDANMSLGPVILFPKILDKLTWADLRQLQPYGIWGFWATDEGTQPPVSSLLEKLQCNSGLSPSDRRMLVNVLMSDLDVNEFYKDVFRSRGMPLPTFSRLCTQVRNNVGKMHQQQAKIAQVTASHQPTSSVQPPHSQPLNDPTQDQRLGLVPSPASLPLAQSAPQVQLTQGSRVEENPSHSSQGPRGTKRSSGSMQEESSHSTATKSNTHLSQPSQQTTGRPAQRPRLSQPMTSSPLHTNALTARTNVTASSPRMTAPTVGGPRASSNGSPRAPPGGQTVPLPQQPGVQRQVGQFDILACRAAQVQSRAAGAVPLQPPSAEVVQAQATSIQAARARIAQSQPTQPQSQLVDASQAHMLQVESRRARAPSEVVSKRVRSSEFTTGFDETAQAQSLPVPAAQAGTLQNPKAQGDPVDETQANTVSTTQSSTHQPLMDPSLTSLDPIDQSTKLQSPALQSSATQTAGTPSPIQPSLDGQSPMTQSSATPSPASQRPAQSNTEDIPGKGKGVLPHAVAKATFFRNEDEKEKTISYLNRAWAAYRGAPEGSALKERAALWIVNFSLNFRQHWSFSNRSGGTFRRTTLAVLMHRHPGVHSQTPGSSAPASASAV